MKNYLREPLRDPSPVTTFIPYPKHLSKPTVIYMLQIYQDIATRVLQIEDRIWGNARLGDRTLRKSLRLKALD
jgi:hypothetical protein